MMNSSMPFRQDHYLTTAELTLDDKLYLFQLQDADKVILLNSNHEVIKEIDTQVFYDSENSRLVFLSKEVKDYREFFLDEYNQAVKNGYKGSKQDYYISRDYY